MKKISSFFQVAVLPVVVTFVLTTIVLLGAKASPPQAFYHLWQGAFGDWDSVANDLITWIPLVMSAVALSFTFSCGLWNIGIEGQIIFGALASTWVARTFDLPPMIFVPVLIIAGLLGGLLWALVAGVIRVYGRVHEIFVGLGLDYIAANLVNFLIFGPWKRPGVASMSGTEPFRQNAWLPTFGESALSPIGLVIAIIVITIAYLTLSNTTWGLRLKAIGKNQHASFLLGLDTDKEMLLAFAICGAIAGMAGSIQAVGLYHRLIPSISSGYGFLGILVALLAQLQVLWMIPISFFFAAAVKGGLHLSMMMNLDASLGRVIQDFVVLFFLLGTGFRLRLLRKKGETK